MDQALIQNEYIRRQYVGSLIGSYISHHFEEAPPKSKIRRGIVQKEIAAHFGIVVNNLFCELVNLCMENDGYKCCIIRGDYYYKGVKRI